MSDHTDWERVAEEVLDRNGYCDDATQAASDLRERFVAELHNAFEAGRYEESGETEDKDREQLHHDMEELFTNDVLASGFTCPRCRSYGGKQILCLEGDHNNVVFCPHCSATFTVTVGDVRGEFPSTKLIDHKEHFA